jgi:hypothetical protein
MDSVAPVRILLAKLPFIDINTATAEMYRFLARGQLTGSSTSESLKMTKLSSSKDGLLCRSDPELGLSVSLERVRRIESMVKQ